MPIPPNPTLEEIVEGIRAVIGELAAIEQSIQSENDSIRVSKDVIRGLLANEREANRDLRSWHRALDRLLKQPP
jgi:hypothetical protein